MVLSAYKPDGIHQLGRMGILLLASPLRQRLQVDFNHLLRTENSNVVAKGQEESL